MLVDLDGWKHWAGAEAHGELRPGQRVSVRWNPTGSWLSYRSRPRVAAVDPPHRFKLVGKLISTRLLGGRRTYELDSTERGGTRLTNAGAYSGFGPLVRRLSADAESFALQLNQKLKRRVEEGR